MSENKIILNSQSRRDIDMMIDELGAIAEAGALDSDNDLDNIQYMQSVLVYFEELITHSKTTSGALIEGEPDDSLD